MRLDAHAVTALWDRGERAPAPERALLLLELALPGRSREELAHLSLGQRDAALAGLRRDLFGADFEGYVDCPACAERLEVAIELPPGNGSLPAPRTFTSRAGHVFRAPDSEDLAAIGDGTCAADAAQKLVTRCCIDGAADSPASWSAEELAEVDAGLATLEGDDVLSAEFTCPACAHAWQAMLDPATLLWEEVQAHAIGLLQAVHRLAAAYGWSEREILALPPARRSLYLALVAA